MYVWFKTFNTHICVCTYTNAFGRYNAVHGMRRNEPNNTWACVSYCYCCRLLLSHLCAIHSNTKLAFTQYSICRHCRRRRTQRLSSVFLCSPSFLTNNWLFRIWCVCCSYALFMFFPGVLHSKLIVRWYFSFGRILKRYWCVYFLGSFRVFSQYFTRYSIFPFCCVIFETAIIIFINLCKVSGWYFCYDGLLRKKSMLQWH